MVSHDKRAVLCRVQFDDIVPRKALFDMEKGIGSMYGLSRVRIAPRYQLNGLTQPYVDSLKEYIVLRKPSAQGYLTDSKWDMTANGLTVSMLGSGVEYLAHDLRQLPEMIRTETGLTCAVNTETSNEETELRLAQKTEQGREQMLKRMMHTPPGCSTTSLLAILPSQSSALSSLTFTIRPEYFCSPSTRFSISSIGTTSA